MISLPLQNNTSFGIGPNDSISNVFNIQPVYPTGLGKKWNLINRAIINYNLKKGWYLTSVPVMTANWTAPSDNRWTIPLGGGFGRIVKWGKQPLDLSAQAFYNVEKPIPEIGQGPNLANEGDTWTLRLQLKLLFPKSK